MRNIGYWIVAFGTWMPAMAIAGGNAAGGGVRSVSVDFVGLELAVLAGCWLAARRP